MSLFNAKYLNDEDIWSRIEKIEKEREKIKEELSRPEVSTEPKKVAKLSKKLDTLNRIKETVDRLRDCLEELETAKEILWEEENEDSRNLVDEYKSEKNKISDRLYGLLISEGFLDEEKEDELDIKIMKLIERVGPEYSIQMAKTLNIPIQKVRNRLKSLTQKGFLKRVQGTMLESYHRQEGWDKHMNHTYYQLSRKGKLYLRKMRKDE